VSGIPPLVVWLIPIRPACSYSDRTVGLEKNSMPGPCDAWMGGLPKRGLEAVEFQVCWVVASGDRRMVNFGGGLVDPCKPAVSHVT